MQQKSPKPPKRKIFKNRNHNTNPHTKKCILCMTMSSFLKRLLKVLKPFSQYKFFLPKGQKNNKTHKKESAEIIKRPDFLITHFDLYPW